MKLLVNRDSFWYALSGWLADGLLSAHYDVIAQVVKQTVMTTVYGVTKAGAQIQIEVRHRGSEAMCSLC